MDKRIRILLADDHRLFLDGIKTIIDSDPELKVVGEAGNGLEALALLAAGPCDIMMLDIQMPQMNGIETAWAIREQYPSVKLIALSMHAEKIFVEKMYRAGVSGYVLKNTNKNELLTAIKAVYHGGTYFSGEIIPAMFSLGDDESMADPGPELTKREKEILILIAQEYSNPQIAEALFLSILTVNTHRKNLLKKLDAKNTAGLVKYAIGQGWV